MEMEYRRTWNQSFMIIKEEIKKEGYELEMLKYNEIMGLLPVQTIIEEGKHCLCYDITGKKSLDSYLENQDVELKMIRRILENLIHLCRELDKYLLSEEHLLLKQEMIFVDGEAQKLYFCYHTGTQNHLKRDFRELLEELMTKLNHNHKEEVEIIYELYQRTQEENYSLLKLQELFFSVEEVYEEEHPAECSVEQEKEWIRDEQPLEKKQPRPLDSLQSFKFLKNHLPQPLEKRISFFHMDKLKGRETKIRSIEEEKILDVKEKDDSRQAPLYARLIYLGRGEEKDFILDQPVFLIGRDNGAVDGVLKSAAAGSVQAKVCKKEDGYYIEDMNSTNGTLVNGELLIYKNARKLEEGDRITFADISYRFLTFCHNSII